ncbi:hypothetical protein F5883DRAFT_529829 [Diaporthe sp. PMI_573]|nr:hypothetical protein F5883DRAFT_529829 [Diaporthaceae sp. PMI_573]
MLDKKIGDVASGKEGPGTMSLELRNAAANIGGKRYTRVKFHGVRDKKAPDDSYYFIECFSINEEVQALYLIQINWAGLSSKKLAEKAEQYIQLSNGKAHTVINVDMNQIYLNSNMEKL